MDVIAGTAFGLDTELQTGDEADTHDMVRAMKNIVANTTSRWAPLVVSQYQLASECHVKDKLRS